MTNETIYKAKTSELICANCFFTFAAHAFAYQDIGRKHYGEFVFGGTAIAVGVLISIIALWASIHYFRRVALCHRLDRKSVV